MLQNREETLYLSHQILKRYQRLEKVKEAAQKAGARPGGKWPLLAKMVTALTLLCTYASEAALLLRQVQVIRDIAHVLKSGSTEVGARTALQQYLDALPTVAPLSPDEHKSGWSSFRDHVVLTSQRWWKGLFFCYDNENLPSTNNSTEAFFGALKGFSRRVTGRSSTSGGPLETCAEFFVEAFSLVRFGDIELLEALGNIPPEALQSARAEFEQLAEAARYKRSVARDPEQALDKIIMEWLTDDS